MIKSVLSVPEFQLANDFEERVIVDFGGVRLDDGGYARSKLGGEEQGDGYIFGLLFFFELTETSEHFVRILTDGVRLVTI